MLGFKLQGDYGSTSPGIFHSQPVILEAALSLTELNGAVECISIVPTVITQQA